MKRKIGLIDYGSGNFTSVWNALKQQDCSISHIQKPEQLENCTHLILPGVGAFSSAIEKLQTLHLFNPIQQIISESRKPFLGICVGLQILAEKGSEFRLTDGFGAVRGRVDHFKESISPFPFRLPHIGWNDVYFNDDSILFRDIDPDESSFYFDHSYRLVSHDENATFSYCDYGEKFIAAFEKGNIFGVQFHPEKSQRNGQQLLKNFLRYSDA